MLYGLLMWIAVCPLENFRAAYCPPLYCWILPLGKNLKKEKNDLPPELGSWSWDLGREFPVSYYIGDSHFSKFFLRRITNSLVFS